MTNKKVTRRALLMSVTSLLICISMLLGTTFAWFTDEVTSGVNKIVAGNLDVELQLLNGTDYEAVQGSTELFQTPVAGPALWEPGAMAIETFKVSNVGSLALRYKFTLNELTADQFNYVTWGTEDTKYDLTDVIKVAITDSRPADRTAAAALTFATWDAFVASSKGAALEPGASDEFTVVLYWEPDSDNNETDNKYNLKNGDYDATDNPKGYTLHNPTSGDLSAATQLSILAGVTLVAAQQTSEADSFDNQYDAAATPVFAATSVSAVQTVVANTETVASAGSAGTVTSTKVTVPENTVTAGDTLALNVEETASDNGAIAISATGGTPLYFDVDLINQDTGASVSITTTELIKAELDLGVGYIVNEVNHDQVAMTKLLSATTTPVEDSWYFNEDTGVLTIYVKHFSPFVLGYNIVVAEVNDVKYSTVQAAVTAANEGDTVSLIKKEIDLSSVISINKSIIIDGKNNTIKVIANNNAINISGTVETTIKNVNIEGKYPNDGIYITANGSSITLEKVVISDCFKAVHTICNNTDILIKDSSLTSVYPYNGNGSTLKSFLAEDSCFNGWLSYNHNYLSTNNSVVTVFKNCSFGEGAGYATLKPYDDTTLINCVFSADYFDDPEYGIATGTKTPISVNFNNCYVLNALGEKVSLTTQTLIDMFNYEITSGSSSGPSTINDQYWYINGVKVENNT